MSKSQQITRVTQRRDRREERRREEERLRAAKKRRTLWISAIVSVVVIVIAAIIIGNILNSRNAQANSSTSSSSTTTLTSDNPAYPIVDDIACQSSEQLSYHIHVHLSIYINGQLSALPANLGIAPDGSCYYWLHTHDTSGVVHIESPTTKTYSLGTFFKEWQDHFAQLGFPSQLGTTTGWKVYVNGKAYTGNFDNIQFAPHMLITMAYNTAGVKPDTTYSWGTL